MSIHIDHLQGPMTQQSLKSKYITSICLLGCPGRTQATGEAPFTFDRGDSMRYAIHPPGSRVKRGWRGSSDSAR